MHARMHALTHILTLLIITNKHITYKIMFIHFLRCSQNEIVTVDTYEKIAELLERINKPYTMVGISHVCCH